MAEIDDSQLRLYDAAYRLLSTLQSHPETRREFEHMVKKTVAPGLQTQDDVASHYTKPILEKLEAQEKRWQKFEDERADRSLVDTLDGVRKKYELTDDGMDALKKYMRDKTIADPEDAYLAWKGRQPASPILPSGMAPSRWGFADADTQDGQSMLADEDGYFDRLASKVWNEAKNSNAA